VEKPRPHPDFQLANTQSMLVTLDKIDIPISDNIELWCTLYDYSSDESGVELIPRFLSFLNKTINYFCI
jgi:hypothetical protein